jgi:CRP-like cAMP-binding protein
MDLRGIFKNAENIQEYLSDSIIFTEGTPGDVMYVIIDGEVEILVGNKSLETIGPGDLLGEMALIDAHARSATAVAKSDARLAPIDEQHFLFMVEQTPFFALHVMRVLVERLRRMDALRNA